ncbi:MAG TPA: helix-turn-helix domain-containing protein, partial [Polymorphobacter sp.]|nr:helix-turn-helix domain-containing protein [Polymorphobacter sp.]
DIPLLLEHFAAASPRRVHFSASAARYLSTLAWRGNVRELRNLVDRATALHAGQVIDQALVEQLVGAARRPVEAWLATPDAAPAAPARLGRTRFTPAVPDEGAFDLKKLLDDYEQSCIEHALDRTAGAVAESARMLGLRRTTLVEKMRRLNIHRMPAC